MLEFQLHNNPLPVLGFCQRGGQDLSNRQSPGLVPASVYLLKHNEIAVPDLLKTWQRQANIPVSYTHLTLPTIQSV